VIVAGDLNLVGWRRQLDTLLHGTIENPVEYGPAAPPDVDGTSLADAHPYHTTGLADWTWHGSDSPFPPGRLDYVVYSDAALELAGGFVLWTPDLAPAELEAAGLRADDVPEASDHLPVVADFRFR
ncbi:MAG TPA: endonuclease/exonuclease/phosphatase family protein, partial [bacterium]|nr:endonuclease/exonuclease/phosphatase family protein [bacterium]